jgi:hypothetical protein
MTVGTLTMEERQTLLALARQTLDSILGGKTPPRLPQDLPEALLQPRGAFVTLHRNGRLRGCIGTFVSTQPLAATIREMVVQAAFHDPRFPEVTAAELASIDLEISALTPLRPIASPDEVQVGRHGLYITLGRRSGVLLPQVATECGWDRAQFLEHTCLKAGLAPDAWQKGASLSVFEAEVFGEKQ